MVIYRTKLGLHKMDILAKRFPRFLNFLSYISITLGYLGMVYILGFLIYGAYQFLFLNLPSPVGIVIPRVEIIPGLPPLSLMHWIISIIVLATVHEFSHGVFARLHKIKIKSSGFAFFALFAPILPAAFVEPDEKELTNASKKAQLSVLSAGSFANVISAIVFFLIFLLILAPAHIHFANVEQSSELEITGFMEDGPLKIAGATLGEKIISIDGKIVTNQSELFRVLNTTSPHELIMLETDANSYNVKLTEHPDDEQMGYLGAFTAPVCNLWKFDNCPDLKSKAIGWSYWLLFWLFTINVGVGLFNLLPLGILDGGKMFFIAVMGITKSEKVTKRIWKAVNIFLLLLLLVLILPQLFKTLILPLINLL